MIEQSPGGGGAQISSFRAKGHQKGITSDDTKRQCGTLGGRGGHTGDRGKKDMIPTHGTGRGMGCRSRLAGGGGGLMYKTEGGRDPCAGKPWGRQEPGHRLREARGGNQTG